jgi:Protein of unknown function (DUF3500)
MKILLQVGCVLLVGAAVVLAQKKPGADDAARAAVIKLYDSFNDEQKKQALLEFDHKDRYAEIFPETKRPGIAFAQLAAEQKTLVDDILKAVCSEYGASRCLEIAKQTGPGGRYITFYGTPAADGKFAWRLAQHHLTLLYAEFGKDKANEFGPVLLGGNPTKTVWDEEEKVALELFQALSDDERKASKGNGNSGSGAALDAKTGIRIGDLSAKAKPLAVKLFQQRIGVFSDDRQKLLDDIVKREGGIENLRIAFWGEASKSQHEGGNYHWKIGNALVLVDWQTVGKEHIHMTVRARAK